ncbi:MAG: tyrosine-protein phosphatase [Sarcina sp.]
MERLSGELLREKDDNLKIVLNKEVKNGELFYKNYLGDDEKFLMNFEGKEIEFKDVDVNNRNFYTVKAGEEKITLGERLVKLKNFCNFRDLGGFKSEDGRYVKWGNLYRSEVLCAIEDCEMDYFKSLGIKYVFDYRSKGEADQLKDMEFDGIKNINISAMNTLDNENLDMEAYFYDYMQGKAKVTPIDMLKESYKTMPFDNEAYRELINVFKDYNNRAILQHCTAGKDRTGLGSALLLLILGVDEDTIINDYMKSNDYRKEANENIISLYADKLPKEAIQIFREILGVEKDFIEASLNAMKEKYGNYENYFLKEYGLTKEEMERIKDNYLE